MDAVMKSNSKVWKAFSESAGGRYEAPFILKGEQIKIKYNDLNILYELLTTGGGGKSSTMVKVPFKAKKEFNFLVTSKSGMNFPFGMVTIKASLNAKKYPSFSMYEELTFNHSFSGDNKELSCEVFCEDTLSNLCSYDLITFQIICKYGSGELLAILDGPMKDLEQFKAFHALFCTILDKLKELEIMS